MADDPPPPLYWDGTGDNAVEAVKDQAEKYLRWLLLRNHGGQLPASCTSGDGVCKAMIKDKVLVPTGKWSTPHMHGVMAETFRSVFEEVVVYVQGNNF